jgi:hypothetical protein
MYNIAHIQKINLSGKHVSIWIRMKEGTIKSFCILSLPKRQILDQIYLINKIPK